MESILGRALEYTLKYWLKSFSREQFKLQGRTAHLSNLGKTSQIQIQIAIQIQIQVSFRFRFTDCESRLSDIDGDALHSSIGLPPALNVVSAKVGKLEITVEFE